MSSQQNTNALVTPECTRKRCKPLPWTGDSGPRVPRQIKLYNAGACNRKYRFDRSNSSGPDNFLHNDSLLHDDVDLNVLLHNTILQRLVLCSKLCDLLFTELEFALEIFSNLCKMPGLLLTLEVESLLEGVDFLVFFGLERLLCALLLITNAVLLVVGHLILVLQLRDLRILFPLHRRHVLLDPRSCALGDRLRLHLASQDLGEVRFEVRVLCGERLLLIEDSKLIRHHDRNCRV